jgi:hypothetical protein
MPFFQRPYSLLIQSQKNLKYENFKGAVMAFFQCRLLTPHRNTTLRAKK